MERDDRALRSTDTALVLNATRDSPGSVIVTPKVAIQPAASTPARPGFRRSVCSDPARGAYRSAAPPKR